VDPVFRSERCAAEELEHRADPKGRVSEKWTPFSALNDARPKVSNGPSEDYAASSL
jgi:hypothetical protein